MCVIKSIFYLHRTHFFFVSFFFCSCTHDIGLYEGCIVSCKIVDEVPVLDVVNVTASNEKDWEMLVSMSNAIFDYKFHNELDLMHECNQTYNCMQFFSPVRMMMDNDIGSDKLSNTKYTVGSNENRKRWPETCHLDQQSDEHIR